MSLRQSGLVCLLALLAGVLPVRAQTVGEIRGQVLDATGAPLAGVTLSATSVAGAVTGRGAVSDAGGRFRIPALPASGDYALKASLEAHATVVLSGIEVEAGQVTILTLSLRPESDLRERITVRATPQVVDTAQTTTSTKISTELLDAVPILGRDYQDALTLAPGVTDVDGDGNPSIHGSRETDIGTFVDGVSSTDPLTGKVGAKLNIETIQEIEIKTAGSTAEFGRAQGGTVNILTKSGGNDFEGIFKFYWRGSRLDGDGAGQDDPLLHAGLGEIGLRDLEFSDYLPFVSVSGPIVRDHAWYFAAIEYVSREEPVNALSAAFLTSTREWRQFAKVTWQVSPGWRLGFSLNHDPQEYLNQGLNSLTREETGFALDEGGLLATIRGTGVLSPTVALETTAAWFEGSPALVPNLGPDTNGNGFLSDDKNRNGFHDAIERDPGEDYDRDGMYDVFEDYLLRNDKLDLFEERCVFDRVTQVVYCVPLPPAGPGIQIVDEDVDGDLRLTPPRGCEGPDREDVDCDGHLDRIDEDRFIRNGRLDSGEDIDGDGRLDRGIEDRNKDKMLNDFPRPQGLYPYGRLAPVPQDRDYQIDLFSGFVSGPYYKEYDDTRARGTLRQDLSIFTTLKGTHDLKVGYLVERESFHRETEWNDIVGLRDPGWDTGRNADKITHPGLDPQCNWYQETCVDPREGRISVSLPIERETSEEAKSLASGVYVQDLYRPRPNLSLGIGLRFDRENASSDGYTFFEPGAERDLVDRLNALMGQERSLDDEISGNGDGIRTIGIVSDPVFQGQIPQWFNDAVLGPMRQAGFKRLTMPRASVEFFSGPLSNLFPEIFTGGDVDLEQLRAAGVPVQVPEAFAITNNNLAPRLSVSWDPWSDGRTKTWATWGRYYDKLFLSSVTGEQTTARVLRYYIYDRTGIEGGDPVKSGTPNHNISTLLAKSAPSVSQVERGLKTPYCDEATIGFEREIAPEMALSVRYIARRYRDQLQDVDVNHRFRISRTTGQPVDRLGRLDDVPLTQDPNGPTVKVRFPDGRPDLFLNNPFFNEVLRVGNYNSAEYNALEIELRKRLSRRWEMQGSYVYSRALGDAEDFQSRLGNDPSTVTVEAGYLDFDQRHVVKLNGITFLPHDWQLGMAATWSSGLPYSAVSRFFALDNADYQQFRTLYGTVAVQGNAIGFQDERRNSRRNDSTFEINLRTSKQFVIGKHAAGLFLEVFDLLNTDDLWIHSIDAGRSTGFDPSGEATVAGPLQLDATRQFGRRWQVGFQFAF
jgi:carboxypeptidase family protein/TonB-dependent receptor-like protein